MIQTFYASSWGQAFSPQEQLSAMTALENGHVLYFPELAFELLKHETAFLSPNALKGSSKNISFEQSKGIVKGSRYQGSNYRQLLEMMNRFVQSAQGLVHSLFPQYQPHLINGRTSYRPIEIFGRKNSVRKDDTRLHVDAFPATPNHGRRILRVFSNINPHGKSRIWNLGEPFEKVVERFSQVFHKPFPCSRALLSFLQITKTYRSLYDHYMLQLHDNMKEDDIYQQTVEKQTHHFLPGSSWVVMTDSVSHAALSGQYVLEHTFYLPVLGMQEPAVSPLHILEKRFGKPLSHPSTVSCIS